MSVSCVSVVICGGTLSRSVPRGTALGRPGDRLTGVQTFRTIRSGSVGLVMSGPACRRRGNSGTASNANGGSMSVYAPGQRNPFGLLLHSNGNLYATGSYFCLHCYAIFATFLVALTH